MSGPLGPPLTIVVDGRQVPALPGQSVGAALVASGMVSWRRTRFAGRPRGLFCGIGVCYDCLLEVDGVPERRSCLVPVRDGMQIRTSEGAPEETSEATS